MLVDKAVQAEALHLQHGPWVPVRGDREDFYLWQLVQKFFRQLQTVPIGQRDVQQYEIGQMFTSHRQPLPTRAAPWKHLQTEIAAVQRKEFRNQTLVFHDGNLAGHGFRRSDTCGGEFDGLHSAIKRGMHGLDRGMTAGGVELS